MNTQLLQDARQAKAKQDAQQALIDQLPQLEAEAHQEAQRAEIAQKRAWAEQLFQQAITEHNQRDKAFEANYNELKSAFRSFVQMLKSDNRSYENVRQAAYNVAYYIAQGDDWGLTKDNVERHQEQLMIDNEIKNVTLPAPNDGIDDYLNIAIQEALRVP